MNSRPYILALFIGMFFIVYIMTNIQYEHTEMETRSRPFDSMTVSKTSSIKVGYLPRGIVQPNSDMELKPLWSTGGSNLKDTDQHGRSLLAIPVGIKQKANVDAVVRKFSSENFAVVLFHYDANVDGWHDLEWYNSVIHIVASNQTKWWFAKRFLHPDVVSIYDYIFLWDEDLEVEHFHPKRYLNVMKSEGLEISQPALDPILSEIHHKITARRKKGKVHRRAYDCQGKGKYSSRSDEPPCTGWVEGMAPVFSRSAWHCVWHLIQNDLIHGWGMDMKLGYCAQGDRTKMVGIIDSEYIVHQGIHTLGGSSEKKSHRVRRVTSSKDTPRKDPLQKSRGSPAFHTRVKVRRRARLELQDFEERWNRAIKEKGWVDAFLPKKKMQI